MAGKLMFQPTFFQRPIMLTLETQTTTLILVSLFLETGTKLFHALVEKAFRITSSPQPLKESSFMASDPLGAITPALQSL